MAVKMYVFETRGGELLTEVSPAGLTWSENANQAETVSPVFNLRSGAERSRDWRNIGTPWKHSIALDVHGRLLGGPIMPHGFDDDRGQLQITARGGRMLFKNRSILPPAALTQPLTLPSGELDATLDSFWTGFDLGTIAKKIGQQACTWPGADDLPIIWPDDRAGTHERTYPAIDRKKIDSAWADLSNVENGPDVRLGLEWKDDHRFQWRFTSGTQEQPRLAGPDVFVWELGQGSGITVDTDPTRMGSLAWAQGGRASDTALVRSLYDPFLVDHGFPLLELETGASVNTVDPSTLDSSNVETLRTARQPWEFWSFKVRADRSPFPFEYGPGSLIEVIVTKYTEVSGGYIPPGTYTRRIAGLSGRLDNWITITCGENYDEEN